MQSSPAEKKDPWQRVVVSLHDLRCLRLGGFLCFDLKACIQANMAHPVENP